MSGGSKTTQTQTGQTSPYAQAQPLLNTGLADALKLYKGGQLNPYVAPSARTTQALQGLDKAAIAGRGSLNSALGTFNTFAKGGNQVGSSVQSGIAQDAMGPSYSEQNLADVASGKLIGQGDPNYDRLRQRAQENAATEAGMVASGMGRTGSDYHQTAVARQVGDTTAGMDYQRLQDERARQVEANSLMDSMRQAGLGLGLNAANSASAIQGSNYDRQLGAAGSVPGAYQATLSPYQTVLGVGQQYDADRAAKAGTRGLNLSSLAQLLGMSAGYGTTTGQTQQPSNPWGQIAGGGLTLASILSQL